MEGGFNFEKSIKFLPVIYSVLIFVGYLDYDFYYSVFDINIIHYLNTSEFLLSFLVLTKPFLLLPLILFSFLIFVMAQESMEKNNKASSNHITNQEVSNFSLLYNNNHRKVLEQITKLKNFPIREKPLSFLESSIMLVKLSLHTLMKLFLWISIPIYVIGSISSFDGDWIESNNKIDHAVATFVLIFTIPCLLMALHIIARVNKLLNYRFYFEARVFTIMVLSLVFLSITNQFKALNVMDATKSPNTSFIYEGKKYKTSNKLIYLGRTSDYLFLRDLGQQKNLIFPSPNISFLEFTSPPVTKTKKKPLFPLD